MPRLRISYSAALFVLFFRAVCGCTNVLVTPGASADGSAMIAYNADSENLVGMLYHYNASKLDASSSKSYEATGAASLRSSLADAVWSRDDPKKMRKIYDWDTGVYHGVIPEAAVTYNVVGNTNEHGLVIAESTFGGVEILGPTHQPNGIIDYGSLIYITLQRTKTAREAITTIAALLDEYGYASSGESFSLTDQTGEVWLMEMIGRGGSGRLGAAWVARRIPDGYVTAHANQARITTFPRKDAENCLFSDDVVDLAVQVGLYERGNGGDDSDFSFSDVYDPVTFLGARACDARVWSVFGPISEDDGFLRKYTDYAKGDNLHNRMPLWVKPKARLSLMDLMHLMSNHYENTPLQDDSDVGAGPYASPYRPRPLEWQHDHATYFNERAIATQQTGWNFVAQVRNWMPPKLASILWFAVDDSSTSPRYPVYGSSRRVSQAYSGVGNQDGVVAPVLKFRLDKAFWVQNMVANLAYSRWNEVFPIVQAKIETVQTSFIKEVESLDEEALNMYNEGSAGEEAAVDHVTQYSVVAGDTLHATWLEFYGELFARFRDGYDTVKNDDNVQCGCDVRSPGFTDAWKRRIVTETGKRYQIPSQDDVPRGTRAIDVDAKAALLALQ